jgi:hypothetical protein
MKHHTIMKMLRILPVVVAVLAAIFVLSRQSHAQSTSVSDNKGALGRYAQLFLTLSERGDTNTAAEVSGLVSAIRAERDAADIATTVRALENLRAGQTNDAIRLLETRLDGVLINFGASSDGLRDTNYDNSLKMAKRYRAKYPHTSGIPEIDNDVTRAFSLSAK